MRCTRPRTAGLRPDGSLIWSSKQFRKADRKIQLPCGKCIECRLAYSREWGLRSVHEATQHDQNTFLTLTYDDSALTDPKLNYEDFQVFIRALRDSISIRASSIFTRKTYVVNPISYIVAGEYGSKTKRPHWHTVIFGYKAADEKFKYTSKSGHPLFSSESLDKIWGKGIVEAGAVTLESASYCARYALKELAHGELVDEYKPLFKASTRPAIAARWLETFCTDVFNHGRLHLADGSISEIPRYYKKWCEKHRPDLWAHYVTQVQPLNINRALTRAEKEFNETLNARIEYAEKNPKKALRAFREKDKVRDEISAIRLKKLQEVLKL